MLFCGHMSVSWMSLSLLLRAGGSTYVDTPELLDAVEADDLLEQLMPVLLAARRLGEPQRPLVLQLVLDIEVGRVVEDGDDGLLVVGAVGGVGHGAARRDGDAVEGDGLRGAVGSDVGHVGGDVGVSEGVGGSVGT